MAIRRKSLAKFQGTYVGEANPIRAVDVERLSFSVCTAAGRRISEVSNSHPSR